MRVRRRPLRALHVLVLQLRRPAGARPGRRGALGQALSARRRAAGVLRGTWRLAGGPHAVQRGHAAHLASSPCVQVGHLDIRAFKLMFSGACRAWGVDGVYEFCSACNIFTVTDRECPEVQAALQWCATGIHMPHTWNRKLRGGTWIPCWARGGSRGPLVFVELV